MRFAFSDEANKVWIVTAHADRDGKIADETRIRDGYPQAKKWVRLPKDFVYPDRKQAHLWRIENGTVVVGKG